MKPRESSLFSLILASIGIVYGDIGTSPLYTLKAAFIISGVTAAPENVLGIVSLVLWSIILVVIVKYFGFLTQVTNRGDGGVMALIALLNASPAPRHSLQMKRALILIGLAGTALLYGDAVIAPAISVLTAVEGINVAFPKLEPLVTPLTIFILITLFITQTRGTIKIGFAFGPVVSIWFAMISVIGLPWIFTEPQILHAFNPAYALEFLYVLGWSSWKILGAIVLCVTGSEALYAALGHFGRKPLQIGWYGIVLPSLVISYLGQGAYLLVNPNLPPNGNPFYLMVPEGFLWIVIFISTSAAVIASQALISGIFSITQQAIQMGFLPRLTVVHTSRTAEGQIYIPSIAWLLCSGSILMVLFFGKSSALASAYGLAVTGTMLITTFMFFWVSVQFWKIPAVTALPIVLLFISLDMVFFWSSVMKIPNGGWTTLVIGGCMFAVMLIWKRGRAYLSRFFVVSAVQIEDYIEKISKAKLPRVPGTAVFMTPSFGAIPSVLDHTIAHNRSRHERIILLSIKNEHVPEVLEDEMFITRNFQDGFMQICARFGYMQRASIPKIFDLLRKRSIEVKLEETSFYLGRDTLLPTGDGPLGLWEKYIFMFLSKNSRPATSYFEIPLDRVIEVGTQLEI